MCSDQLCPGLQSWFILDFILILINCMISCLEYLTLNSSSTVGMLIWVNYSRGVRLRRVHRYFLDICLIYLNCVHQNTFWRILDVLLWFVRIWFLINLRQFSILNITRFYCWRICRIKSPFCYFFWVNLLSLKPWL
jgi:hypothetical protein